MKFPLTVVTAVVDRHNLTIYTADGQTMTIAQGDPRIKPLVDKMVPVLSVPGQTYQLTAEDLKGRNNYAETEKKTNGLVRFFKMAKKKFQEIAEKFCEPVPDQVLGNLPGVIGENKPEEPVYPPGYAAAVVEEIVKASEPERNLPPEDQRPLTQGEKAVAEIMANAVTTQDPSFQVVRDADMAKQSGEEEEIVVAVTQDNTVIHGVEQLSDQMAAVAAGVTSGIGMQRFLERAASVKRGHSVEDLLKFIQKGELPLADDGCVLVYKRLKQARGSDPELFADVHSGNVKQRVGSFVHMAESMVDPDRHADCSHGLHVARRDYLRAFSGGITVLCKLAPEDVIAVPAYDARKLRARAYHIIDRLSDEDARLVCADKPMLDTEMLARAVAGNHTPILEYVEITAARGGGLKVTQVETPEQRAEAETRKVSSLEHLPELSKEAATVDARALALAVAEPVVEEPVFHAPPANMVVESDPIPAPVDPVPMPVAAVKQHTPAPAKVVAAEVEAFNNAGTKDEKLKAARALVQKKKASRKSWTALNVPAAVSSKAVEIVEADDFGAKNPVVKADLAPSLVKPAAKSKPAPTKKAPAKSKASPQPLRDTFQAKGTPPTVKEKKMTQQEEMAKLVALYEANPDKANARAIYAFKQKSKKSWEVLGVTDVKFQKKITERTKL